VSKYEIHKARQVEAYRSGRKIGWITVTDIGNGQWLRSGAADDFRRMQRAALLDCITLRPNSGFRSYKHQKRLRDEWQEKVDAGFRAPRPAWPGTSVHNRGEAVDINRSHDDPDGRGPKEGATDKWLRKNARRFNFVRTIQREPWHFEWII
jgi:LAS superfamily LD-carboxypeptidase LdcB